MPKRERLGPTGKFPDGKLNPTDRGEIAIAVGAEQGNVVLNFGVPTIWIGLPPTQAREVAAMMVKHADSIEHRTN